VFGVDAQDITQLRKDRKNLKTDPRFDELMADIEGGMFGDKDYFKPLVDSISNMKVGLGVGGCCGVGRRVVVGGGGGRRKRLAAQLESGGNTSN